MTVRIKPLVWRIDASNDTYVSTQGGFTVKHGGPSGWEWRRGHIFGFADSRQGAFDGANERHLYEVSALLKPATPTAQLSAALQVPEIAALVDAAKDMRCQFSPFPSDDTERWREEHGACEAMDAALVAMKGPQT